MKDGSRRREAIACLYYSTYNCTSVRTIRASVFSFTKFTATTVLCNSIKVCLELEISLNNYRGILKIWRENYGILFAWNAQLVCTNHCIVGLRYCRSLLMTVLQDNHVEYLWSFCCRRAVTTLWRHTWWLEPSVGWSSCTPYPEWTRSGQAMYLRATTHPSLHLMPTSQPRL